MRSRDLDRELQYRVQHVAAAPGHTIRYVIEDGYVRLDIHSSILSRYCGCGGGRVAGF